MIIKDIGREPERSLAGSEVHVHTVSRNRYRPKQAIRRDVRIVVVNLVGPNGTVVQVQSDEPKGRIVMLSVNGHVFTNHKAHVGLKRQ